MSLKLTLVTVYACVLGFGSTAPKPFLVLVPASSTINAEEIKYEPATAIIFPGILQPIKPYVGPFLTKAVYNIGSGIQVSADALDNIQNIKPNLSNLQTIDPLEIGCNFLDIKANLANSIQEAAANVQIVKQNIAEKVQNITQPITTVALNKLQILQNAKNQIINGIQNAATNILNVKQDVADSIQNIVEPITNIANGIQQASANAIDNIQNIKPNLSNLQTITSF